MSNPRPGQTLESYVQELFGAEPTKGSGSVWGDGDCLLGPDISIEVKDVKRAQIDSWWSQARRQAMRYGKDPVLIMRRPPAELEHGKAVSSEVLAVIPAKRLAELLDIYYEGMSN